MKINKGTITITEGNSSGSVSFDLSITDFEKSNIERTLGLSSGEWYKGLIVIVNLDGSSDEIQAFGVTVENTSGNTVQVTVKLASAVGTGHSVKFNVDVIIPHSIIR